MQLVTRRAGGPAGCVRRWAASKRCLAAEERTSVQLTMRAPAFIRSKARGATRARAKVRARAMAWARAATKCHEGGCRFAAPRAAPLHDRRMPARRSVAQTGGRRCSMRGRRPCPSRAPASGRPPSHACLRARAPPAVFPQKHCFAVRAPPRHAPRWRFASGPDVFSKSRCAALWRPRRRGAHGAALACAPPLEHGRGSGHSRGRGRHGLAHIPNPELRRRFCWEAISFNAWPSAQRDRVPGTVQPLSQSPRVSQTRLVPCTTRHAAGRSEKHNAPTPEAIYASRIPAACLGSEE